MRYAYPNELYHYGIPGMKWGIRRFQNPDGTLTAAGRRRYAITDPELLKRLESKQYRTSKDLKKAVDYEKGRSNALKSGSAKDLLAYKDSLSSQEVNNAIERINGEMKLKALSEQEASNKVNKGINAVQTLIGSVKTAGVLASEISNTYNNVAKIRNTAVKNKAPWRLVGDNTLLDTLKKEQKLAYVNSFFENAPDIDYDSLLKSPKLSAEEKSKIFDMLGKYKKL